MDLSGAAGDAHAALDVATYVLNGPLADSSSHPQIHLRSATDCLHIAEEWIRSLEAQAPAHTLPQRPADDPEPGLMRDAAETAQCPPTGESTSAAARSLGGFSVAPDTALLRPSIRGRFARWWKERGAQPALADTVAAGTELRHGPVDPGLPFTADLDANGLLRAIELGADLHASARVLQRRH